MERKSIAKKVRFEIFKRDNFTCAYCGSKPPKVILEIDHIMPVSKGGDNDILNLITSCFDCNRGKGATELSKITESISKKAKKAKELEEQLSEYKKLQSKIKARKTREINKVANVYSDYFEEYRLTKNFKNVSIGKFIEELPINEVVDAMEKACSFTDDSNDSVKYFCGICWNKIRGEK